MFFIGCPLHIAKDNPQLFIKYITRTLKQKGYIILYPYNDPNPTRLRHTKLKNNYKKLIETIAKFLGDFIFEKAEYVIPEKYSLYQLNL